MENQINLNIKHSEKTGWNCHARLSSNFDSSEFVALFEIRNVLFLLSYNYSWLLYFLYKLKNYYYFN